MLLDGGKHNQSDRKEHEVARSEYLTLNPTTPPLSVRGGWVGLIAFQCNVKVYMSNTSRTFRNRLPGE